MGKTIKVIKEDNLVQFDTNSRLIGKDPDPVKDWGQEEKETAEDEVVR